ncbi:HpcH/HpaI aldolase/citrate lyase family protein [Sinirhodobacter sp. WL0062]|uniref:HpcH/HpaI aldolase/citrate lyase family protein n=1 Tax=Rhodobacter flavimaris TaxID=2907145 RepID=A0ABS8YX03_9RHOB|nr:HpcH/HpaI aldolase/citrate lyase family protein [Sinirhodobacter sp. WL0062]MCE5973083.1 HpcH/HpaI aldolase/citrate lyase family protein [Sinirhodobacter sp. WL0062]
MQIPHNSFKAAIVEGRQQIGIWCTTPHPAHAEALATCGYDWMLIDTEHAAVGLETVHAMLQAAAPWPTQCVVRPGSLDLVEIKRLLDIGAQSLLIPMVNTAEQAQLAVAATRYAPQGLRGYAGISRATHYGLVEDYATKAAGEICVLVQVESVEAVANIEEICAVDGVDGLFIGPADLAASMGYPGQGAHPEVRTVALDALARIRACGKPAGILTLNAEFLAAAHSAGTTFTAVGVDQALLLNAARSLAAEWKAKG